MLNWELQDLLKPRVVYGKSKIIQYPWGSIGSVLIKILIITENLLPTNCLYNTVNVANAKVDRIWQLREVRSNQRESLFFSIAFVMPDVATMGKGVH